MKSAGVFPPYQYKTLEYFENNRQTNGSYGNDPYVTAKVLKALSISSNPSKLVINDIVPNSVARTGVPFNFNIVMSNPGDLPVTTGMLHLVTDDYLIRSFDFVENNIVVNPGTSLSINVIIDESLSLVGNVKFKAFVEGRNSAVYPDSRYEETIAFAPDTGGFAGLPIYYVAYKNTVAPNIPAVTWKWPRKTDPNLLNYTISVRDLAGGNWSSFIVASSSEEVTVQGFQSDHTYEVTMGTLSKNGGLSNFLGSKMVQVKTSSNPSAYTNGTVSGKVISLDKNIGSVSVLGVNANTNTVSDESGNYTQSNVPWGSGYAKVSDFRYENYVRDYKNYNYITTGAHIYTNLKPDNQIPVVSNVSIVGEADKVFENNKTKYIQFSVNDDIGISGVGIVESATVSYFDPNDSSWHLIGATNGFIYGTITMPWNVPNSLLGSGYKIKVVARDFSGKDSLPVEWGGTFQIVQGNAAPEFVFVEPGNATSTADLKYLIKWTDKDDDSSATTTISYDVDNNATNTNHVLITRVSEDDPLNQYEWNTSQIATTTVYIRVDSFDGVNATTTVYSIGRVYINHPTAPDTLAPTVSFTGITADNLSVTNDSSYIFGPIVKIDVKAIDNVGITSVKFFLKNASTTIPRILVNEDFTLPYQSSITTALYPNGKYFVEAVAKDPSGNTATSTLTDYPLTFDN